MTGMRATLTGWLAALAVLTAASGAAAEQMVVVDAVGIGLTPGQTLDESRPVVLDVGQSLTLVTADGRTITLQGPWNAVPIPAAGAGQGGVSQSLAGLFAARAADTSSLCTIRGAGEQPPVPEPWLVEIGHGGSRCVAADGPVVFWREAAPPRAATLVVTPADRSWSARATWPAGSARLGIPPSLPLRDGGTYSIAVDGGTQSTAADGGTQSIAADGGTQSIAADGGGVAVTIHVVPATLPSAAARVAWMADVGCEAQAKALYATLK